MRKALQGVGISAITPAMNIVFRLASRGHNITVLQTMELKELPSKSANVRFLKAIVPRYPAGVLDTKNVWSVTLKADLFVENYRENNDQLGVLMETHADKVS